MCVNSLNSCDLNKIAYLCKKEAMQMNCVVCGKEYQVIQSALKRGWGTTCSKSCAAKNKVWPKKEVVNNAVCAHCSKPFYVCESKLKRGNGKYCSAECKKFGRYPQLVGDTHKQCIDCKQVFERSEFRQDNRGRILARCNECHRVYDNARNKKYTEVRQRAGKKFAISQREAAQWQGKSSEVRVCSCEQCGKKWVNKGKVVKRFCGIDCGREYRRLKSIGKPLVLVEREYKCRSCGEMFINTISGRCDKCKEAANKAYRKAQKKKRKAALRTVAIHAVVDTKVFTRDKWKCCECKCKVQKKDIYADNAAELDHVVPVSLGGPHSYSNVQALCRRCNQNKSNKYNGQLVMCL